LIKKKPMIEFYKMTGQSEFLIGLSQGNSFFFSLTLASLGTGLSLLG